ncbi:MULTISPECIES: siderophore-interacting protein [unclassified Rhodococcus (in: high G+C Gram-positive bacteria)]|uniref:siderophore-interacting protein n=1 Tax=unclassified Rhodococcus (in: high G+C Gram-positive bacteria) TaxID=192944 RepID=UPI0024B7CED4|nr:MULTISPECIES: siderophore-interacting protein [unclassified Rhodococcus (in: high G+C Gram-positive bacteria)]MDI9955886.1 siderophore-interacting protein [Rhodococcus sp. IEGM 1237]MDI9961908.1 siderophore-interacting protein [Rhodococcus sp. IEGM 1251]MDV8123952.1 siderophore-interacting protein [Rhodococcus sp. IEGM 1304]
MVRIVFGGEELTAFETTGTGDEYLRLHFPVPATGKFVLPAEDPDAPRGWRYPEGEEPSPCQPYTVRRFDSETSCMTIDFVVHEGGIASDWAQKPRSVTSWRSASLVASTSPRPTHAGRCSSPTRLDSPHSGA